ncbi:hypothetical protein JTB14_003087 [Gonioctena quinquepunctata]|nr:hypothetical protein JTB14_003087 [Gonioctena quinquepunctata]
MGGRGGEGRGPTFDIPFLRDFSADQVFVVGVSVLFFGLVTRTQKKIPNDLPPAVGKRIDCTIGPWIGCKNGVKPGHTYHAPFRSNYDHTVGRVSVSGMVLDSDQFTPFRHVPNLSSTRLRSCIGSMIQSWSLIVFRLQDACRLVFLLVFE